MKRETNAQKSALFRLARADLPVDMGNHLPRCIRSPVPLVCRTDEMEPETYGRKGGGNGGGRSGGGNRSGNSNGGGRFSNRSSRDSAGGGERRTSGGFGGGGSFGRRKPRD